MPSSKRKPNIEAKPRATAVADVKIDHAALEQVVSFTVPANRRSRAVMERLGMARDPAGDFDHPSVPPDHPLRPRPHRLRRGVGLR